MSRKFAFTWDQGKKQKNSVKKREKNTFFLVFFFTFALIEANVTRDEICTFSIFGVHVVKKNMIFYTFFGIFFISHLILRNKKCMTNSKKVRFLAFCPTLLNKKSFFQHFFYIFLTKKFSISHHIVNNYFFLFCYAHPRANIQKNVDISVPIHFVD